VQILSLAAQGLTSKEIADQLGISRYTVDDHVASAMRKLGATSRVPAVAEALATGLISVRRTTIGEGETRTAPEMVNFSDPV
jgi:DNA-binding CsgD family transcriptional regulator